MEKNKIKALIGLSIGIGIYAIVMTILMIMPKEEKVFKEESNISSKRTIAIYINEGDGNYTISNSKEFPKEGYVLNTEKTTCRNGGTFSQDSTTKKINGTFRTADSCNLYFDKEQAPDSSTTLANLNLTAKKGSPTFANAATTDETADGLYAMEDDYGTSYYFRGAVENNYVKFGGFYWRIIRINGDGSLRMIYDGTSAHANGESNTDRLALTNVEWNTTNYDDAKYVGYMYGGTNGSASTSKEQAQTNEVNTNIKTQLENWYKTNIRDKGLDEYVADSIYCNDRTTPGESETGASIDTGLGYGKNLTYYGGHARLAVISAGLNYNNPKPTFVCPTKNDAFTKEDVERGNGSLGEKVGLITADEIVAAGSGKYNTTNQNYYLYKGNWYWSLSPYDFNSAYSTVFIVATNGDLGRIYVYGEGGVAPVISLNSEYVSTLRGEGTQTSPYEIG